MGGVDHQAQEANAQGAQPLSSRNGVLSADYPPYVNCVYVDIGVCSVLEWEVCVLKSVGKIAGQGSVWTLPRCW